MYFSNSDIATNVPGMTDEMRDYCRTTSCRRAFISEYFNSPLEKPADLEVTHDCCDVCECICKCTQCIELDPTSRQKQVTDTNKELKDPLVQEQIEIALMAYFNMENASTEYGSLQTGLSQSLAKNIANEYNLFENTLELNKKYLGLPDLYIQNITCIISQVLFSKLCLET